MNAFVEIRFHIEGEETGVGGPTRGESCSSLLYRDFSQLSIFLLSITPPKISTRVLLLHLKIGVKLPFT